MSEISIGALQCFQIETSFSRIASAMQDSSKQPWYILRAFQGSDIIFGNLQDVFAPSKDSVMSATDYNLIPILIIPRTIFDVLYLNSKQLFIMFILIYYSNICLHSETTLEPPEGANTRKLLHLPSRSNVNIAMNPTHPEASSHTSRAAFDGRKRRKRTENLRGLQYTQF